MRYIFFLLLIVTTARAQQTKSLNNQYFNQPVPADSAVIFAEGIISDQFGNRDMAISPNGDEMFYTLQSSNGVVNAILYSKKINGKWTAPEVASFSGLYSDMEPAFSPDGNKLYFSSNRSLSGVGKRKDYDIWFVTKDHGAWVNAENIGAPVNSDKNEYYASVAKSGNIYFTRAVENRDEDIMICRFENNRYQSAESLPDEINSTADEFNAFVDPDEKFILFSVYGKADDIGGGDIYISKKDNNGKWLAAYNLGNKINSPALDYCPYITPNKNYFFFTSNRSNLKIPFEKRKTLQNLHTVLNATLNGSDNIYWMRANEIIGR